MEHFTQCSTRQDTLKYGLALATNMSTIINNSTEAKKPYWVRCIEVLNSVILKKILSDYNVNNTPQNERFPSIFKLVHDDIFDNFFDELKQPLLREDPETKKRKINDDWLRFEATTERTGILSQSYERNRGISLTIMSNSEDAKRKNKNLVDIQLPLSEMYMVAVYLFRSEICRSPNYVYCMNYFILQLIRHSLSNAELEANPEIAQKITEILNSGTLEMKNDKANQTNEKVKSFIRPIIDQNQSGARDLFKQTKDGIRGFSIEQIDEVALQAQQAIQSLTDKTKDFRESIGKLTGANPDELKTKMESMGLHERNIRSMIDNISGGMSNNELKHTVPQSIDDLLSDATR